MKYGPKIELGFKIYELKSKSDFQIFSEPDLNVTKHKEMRDSKINLIIF